MIKNKKIPNFNFGVVDIGSYKTVCIIANKTNHEFTILGYGTHFSTGVREGAISDIAKAKESILQAINQAENMADTKLRKFFVSATCGPIKSEIVDVTVELNGRAVTELDVINALKQAKENKVPDERVIASLPIGYCIDNNNNITDPLTMVGKSMLVKVHTIIANDNAVKNLLNCLMQCHIGVERLVVKPLASGYAVLIDDELELGTILIDMGAETTSLGVFFNKQLLHVEHLPIGGNAITHELSEGFQTPIKYAETIKKNYAAVLDYYDENDDGIESDYAQLNSEELNPLPPITLPIIDENCPITTQEIDCHLIAQLIVPRLEEIFDHLQERIAAQEFIQPNYRVILTGGASKIKGIEKVARRIFAREVSVRPPLKSLNLDALLQTPDYAGAIGMANYVAKHDLGTQEASALMKFMTLLRKRNRD